MNEPSYLPVGELKFGFLYKINARNASVGVWMGKVGSFLISRYKFQINFLFEELHYDLDETYGTVKPLQELERSPFNLGDLTTNRGHNEDSILDYLNKKGKAHG